MQKDGGMHLGIEYTEKCEQLASLLGMKKDNDAVRAVIDCVLEDAEAIGAEKIARRQIGIKAA